MFLLVPAYLGSPGQKAVKRLCVCVCVCKVRAHVVLTCTNGISPRHLPVIVASDRP